MGMGAVKSCCGHAKKHLYLWLHVAYFVVLSIAGALSIWLSPKPKHTPPFSFVDALFSAVSAVTETGLGNVEMHRFTLSDQLTLLVLMLVGSQVFTSAIPLFISSRFYSSSTTSPPTPSHPPCTHLKLQEPRRLKRALSLPTILTSHTSSFKEATHSLLLQASSMNTSVPTPLSPKCAFLPISDFLTNENCKHTFSVEDKALAMMSWVTTCYYFSSIVVGFLVCQVSILFSPHAQRVLEQNHVNFNFFSLFAVASAFGNCGFILLDENLVPLQRSTIMLLCLCTLMLMGNTLYAPTMRLAICILHKLSKGERKIVCEYLLNASRRQFTHLFPHKETTWLVGTVVGINAFQMICILGWNWKSQALEGLGIGYKAMVAIFQAISTRTAGMNVVNLSGFSISTLLVLLGSMYISSYPIYLTKKERIKRCYGPFLPKSERSIRCDGPGASKSERCMFMLQLPILRAQDSFLFLATFLICIIERDALKNDPLNFTFFNILFEAISGYANVGLTIGYNCGFMLITTRKGLCKDTLCSFSGRWSTCSKLVMIVIMIVGRQKGLQEDLDWDISPLYS